MTNCITTYVLKGYVVCVLVGRTVTYTAIYSLSSQYRDPIHSVWITTVTRSVYHPVVYAIFSWNLMQLQAM